MPAPPGILRDQVTVEGGFRQYRSEWYKVAVEATFGMPACNATKCPRLDATIKAQASKACKDGGKSLARLQMLLLDAVGPLTSLLEQGQKGRLTPKAAADAATRALRFLGNVSAAISHERRKRVVDCLNRDLRPLLEAEDRFREAALYLFGKEFERSAKGHIHSVKSLRKMTRCRAGPQVRLFFGRAAPSIRLLEGAATSEEATEEEAAFIHTRGKKTEKAEENMPTTNGLRSSRDCRCRGSLCISQSVWFCLFSKKKTFSPLHVQARYTPCRARE